MSDSNSVYEVSPGDAQEVIRAVQLCLTGTEIPAKLTWKMGLFEAWANRVFIGKIAPHLLAVRVAAEATDVAAVIAADNALGGGEASQTAGRAVPSGVAPVISSALNGSSAADTRPGRARRNSAVMPMRSSIRTGPAPGGGAVIVKRAR